MHSSTKYLGGHCDAMGGCLVIKKQGDLSNKLKEIQKLSGAVPSPFESWLVARGIKSLFVRVKAQTANALSLAQFLSEQTQIEKVHYPGLSTHSHHHIASQQMKEGYGAMLSVEVAGGAPKARGLTDKLDLFTTATSLGGVESLIEHRKSVENPESHTPENLLRVSVGLENIDDLINDWIDALKHIE